MNVSVLSPYSVKKVEIIQNTYAIVAQDASSSSGLAVLETYVILKPTRPHLDTQGRGRGFLWVPSPMGSGVPESSEFRNSFGIPELGPLVSAANPE